ncbi:hypothetical protein [Anaplasma platys]|uniref:hypothetical protein n=1 Tax=Anaplasma platys TaxID=949 RepID=UPI00145D79FD|nr:hypothetical protein [Anaplasma platys]
MRKRKQLRRNKNAGLLGKFREELCLLQGLWIAIFTVKAQNSILWHALKRCIAPLVGNVMFHNAAI